MRLSRTHGAPGQDRLSTPVTVRNGHRDWHHDFQAACLRRRDRDWRIDRYPSPALQLGGGLAVNSAPLSTVG